MIALKRKVLENATEVHEQLWVNSGGKQVFLDLVLEPIRDVSGQVTGIGIATVDLTQMKLAEEALRASKDELEHIVAERTAELAAANAQLRSITHDIVTTQEEERRRVSRELHDEAGQALTALKMSLQMMGEALRQERSSLCERMDEAVALTDKTMEQIRRLAQNLRPAALESAGLDITLEGLSREFAQRTQIKVDYAGTPTSEMPEPVNICLYRFLQETLTNASQHGHANEIKVRFQKDAEGLSLAVQDNGQGFDPKAVLASQTKPAGLGLIGMQERLKMVGGWLEIESAPRRGTCLIAHIPLEEA